MDESEVQGEGIENNPEEMPVTPSSDEKSNEDKYAADADPENIEEFQEIHLGEAGKILPNLVKKWT
jgi:hypothetical protein